MKLVKKIWRRIVPTPPPNPVRPPEDEAEELARENALIFMRKILDLIGDYSYNTRSHMPGGMDFTDFIDGLHKVEKWVNRRPDWNLNIIRRAFEKIEFPLLEWIGKDPNVAKKLAKPRNSSD